MKTLEFIYQETAIHFLINPFDKNVMINATEMAKLFNKRIDVFLKAEHTQKFIKALEKNTLSLPPNGGSETVKIIETNTNFGTFMHRKLAYKFASWLDVDFELWVYDTIDELLQKDFKKIKSTVKEVSSKEKQLENIVLQIQNSDNTEAKNLLIALSDLETAKKTKTKAIGALTKQIKMEFS